MELNKKVTIILLTHYFEGIKALTDLIGIVEQGKLIKGGYTKEIIEEMGTKNVDETFIRNVEGAK